MASERPRCFAWCVSLKNACNERWARFRNRFRRRFYATRGRPVDQSTILNETGAPDMIVSKVPYISNKVAPSSMSPKTKVTESPVVDSVLSTDADKDFDKLVEDYVSGAITTAADTLISGKNQQTLDNNTVISADDNASLTSSIISQIADIAVTDSLTNIVLHGDTNQSAANRTRPRTINEFMEMFEMTEGETNDDDLPPVSC